MSVYNFRLALRHLVRRKIYTVVIVLSLAVGFTCAGLLLSFITAELRTDSFHLKGFRTFQAFSDDPFEGKGKLSYLPGQTAHYLRESYPEIENVVQLGTLGNTALSFKDATLDNIELLSVDSTFFSVFSYPIYTGSAKHALTSETIVLTREKAIALFGSDHVVGETIMLKVSDTTRTLVVSAVLDAAPENSHLKFEALVSHDVLKNRFFGGATYLLLADGASRDNFTEKVNKDAKLPGLMGEGKLHYDFEPLRDSYFNPFNKATYMRTRSLPFVRTTAMVCGLIVFMAAFNFISLYLLSLQERKKESGIKKTLGVSIGRLGRSLATEVVLYIAFAFCLAIGLIALVLPVFNSILDASISMRYVTRLDLMAIMGGAMLVLGLVVVGFSLLQQRRVLPISLMKTSQGSRVAFNKSLFTIQFIISITLAVCAVTVIRQMHFLATAPLGFNRDIVVLRADESQVAKLPVLKNKILELPGVRNASIGNGSPVFGNWMIRYDLEDGKWYTAMTYSGDEDYMRTLDLQLLEGNLPGPSSPGRVVNEALVRMFELKDPVGKVIPGTKDDIIIGVVRNFTSTSFKDEYQPAVISFSSGNSRLLIDYQGSSLTTLLPAIEAQWKQIFPGEYFSCHLIQEELMKKYKDDTFLYKTVVSYACVSMIISCFGLFALSWAVAHSRMKEVGIRKVLGATARDIMRLLSFSFLKRIVIAFVVAAPVSYYLMDKWLDNFVRKVTMDATTFASAGIAVTLVALATMSVQMVRAALRNPVDELRTE